MINSFPQFPDHSNEEITTPHEIVKDPKQGSLRYPGGYQIGRAHV